MSDLEVESLEVSHGTLRALACASFYADVGEIVAMVGPNGAGKTTVFDAISGHIEPDDGSVRWAGIDLLSARSSQRSELGISRSFQEIRLAWSLSVVENLKLALRARTQNRLFRAMLHPFASRAEDRDLTRSAEEVLEGHPLGTRASVPARELSFGQQKVLAVSCCIATGASLLMLDEPVGGVAGEYAHWIEHRIKSASKEGRLVLLAEHNLDVARRLADRFLVLDAGVVRAYGPWSNVSASVADLLI